MANRKRAAISPVLAVVILIAITMVGGVATASFTFGLFNSLSGTANVSLARLTCFHGTAAASRCTAYLRNEGDVPTTEVSCSLSGGASTVQYGPQVLPPGTSTYTGCRNAPAATFTGEPVQGTFTLENGITIEFQGIYT
jgi:FlaG/FlaF family flagellin (archaellin)